MYCVSALLLILGIFWSVRLARADYESSQADPVRVIRACQLAPGSAQYWLRAAQVREIDQPDDPAVDNGIARALAINPRYTDAWMARAVREETRGRLEEAERNYLIAAKADHMYKPSWALANFYLRQQKLDHFWIYARKCLEVVEPRRLEPFSYNPAPVFDLAWRVTQDAREIRARLLPPRHFILVDYLDYLGEHNLADAGADVAVDLAAYEDPGDNYVLLNFCDRLIHLAKARRAVDIWNAMARHGLIHAERLDPEQGSSLTNRDLKRAFERVGFDWRLPPAEGVMQNHFPDTGEVRLEFSGDQPDGVLTLHQSVPVLPGGAYRLQFRYRTERMAQADGLSWQLWDYAGQRAIPVTCKLTPNQDWVTGEACFTIPKNMSIARLGLESRRANGSTRIHGTLALRSLALRLEKAK
jgi:hypothetical protein